MCSPCELLPASDAMELPDRSLPEAPEDEYLASINLPPTGGCDRKRRLFWSASRPTVSTSGDRRNDLWNGGAVVLSPVLLQCCRSTLALDDALIVLANRMRKAS